ncbi:uncharacterized protein LOC126795407 [Argentina anserina]|uniref:uncharacterized protein LOC126795407 n=1 Tax=Argentina anserina TaxID=57926 RepID=UPI002176717B|nr:uncharacterized protein LOC126795407 [Potentilla anserina]
MAAKELDIAKDLDLTLALVRKCRHISVLRQVFSITTTADFRKVSALLESSIGNMKWLLSVFKSDGANLSLPSIASNDPILRASLDVVAPWRREEARRARGWWQRSRDAQGTAVRHGCLEIDDRREAKGRGTREARGVACGEARGVVERGGEDHVAPAEEIIGDSDRNKKIVVDEGGVTPLLKLPKEATVVKLVAEMAELDLIAQEFSRENVTRPLVSLLAMETVLDEPKGESGKEREREVESAEVMLHVKVGCVEIVEKESGDLQLNCLMNVMEITTVAESNAELRRSTMNQSFFVK